MRKKFLLTLTVLVILVFCILIAQRYVYKPAQLENKLAQTASEESVANSEEEVNTFAAIADIYQKNGSYYIVLDYLTYLPCINFAGDGDGCDTWGWENQSKKFRTFKIADGAKLSVIRGGGPPAISKSPAELYRILKTDEWKNYYSLRPYNANDISSGFNVKIKGDVLLELEEKYHD